MFYIQHGQVNHKITLKDTLYAPTMPVPLISISHIAKSGYKLTFGKEGAQLTSATSVKILKVPEKNRLYTIMTSTQNNSPNQNAEHAKVALMPAELHHCLGHIYPPATHCLIKDKIVSGIKLAKGDELVFCTACMKAKQSQIPFPNNKSVSTEKSMVN
jgi:hypothetical protein